MKIFTYIFLTASVLMIILNATKLDLKNLFAGDSVIAIISILALACGIILVLIVNKAKRLVSEAKKS